MATCPNCQTCAYETEINFIDWTIDYLLENEIMIFDDDYSLGEINYKTINEFFQNKINE
jgi:hypothetical protein